MNCGGLVEFELNQDKDGEKLKVLHIDRHLEFVYLIVAYVLDFYLFT